MRPIKEDYSQDIQFVVVMMDCLDQCMSAMELLQLSDTEMAIYEKIAERYEEYKKRLPDAPPLPPKTKPKPRNEPIVKLSADDARKYKQLRNKNNYSNRKTKKEVENIEEKKPEPQAAAQLIKGKVTLNFK